MYSAKSHSCLNVLPLLMLRVAFALALALVFTGVVVTHAEATTTTTVNLALNKPAVASSSQNSTSYSAAKAFDGSATTRWSSAFSNPQWIYVDLGANYTVTGVKLVWETAYAKAFKIQASTDAVTWTDIYSTTTGPGGTQNLTVTPTTARYIRMYGTARATPWGYSLWEMEVYGTATTLPDLIVSAVSAPSTAQPGQSVVLSASIKNQGRTSAGTVQAAFYLTKSASSITGATLLGTQNVGSLSAGALLALTTTLSIPSSTSSGTFYVVAVADSSNVTQESNETNNTRASGAIAVKDLTPPRISAVNATQITASNATITWTTDKTSTSQTDYGSTATYGSSTSPNSSLVTSHAVTLSGLAAGKAYHFRVQSKDAAGNTALSSDYTFTTATATAGNTYYVATTGSDNVSCGTVGSPCLTIEHAYENKVSAGDTILVQPGTYTGGGSHPTYGRVRLNKQGTAGSPITIKSVTRGAAILDGGANATYPVYFYLEPVAYNIIDGFVITNTYRCGIVVWEGQNNQFINNEIHNVGTGYSVVGDCGAGVYEDPASSGNYFGNNYIHDNATHGLYLSGDNDTVFNNIFTNNGHFGLQIRGNGTVTNMKVYNNTFASNTKSGIVIYQDMNSVEVKNNIFYQNTPSAIALWDATGSGVVIDNNISYGNPSGDIITGGGTTLSYTSALWNHGNPQFVDVAAEDFDLQSGSPAIEAGLTLSAVTTDFDGIARFQGSAYDIGAFEFIH